MNTLPDDIFIHIMRFNSHPCADMMNDLFQPYRDVLEIQRNSKCPFFRATHRPSFFEWKVHGIGCKQWAILFQRRQECIQMTCLLDRLGNPRIDQKIKRWNEERAQLQGLEYHF